MSDLFHYDTGLPEGPGVMTNCRFTRDPAVNEGQTLLLKADILFDDPDTGEYDARWKCGEKFESNDDGATAERIDGQDKLFHQNTGVARLGISMLACEGAEEVIRERYAERGLTPKHAAYYEGLKFNFVNIPYSGTINGEKAEWTVLEVDEFLGVVEDKPKAASKPAGAAKKAGGATKKAAAAKADEADAVDAVDDASRARVYEIAYEAADEESYVEAALAEFADSMTPALQAMIEDVGPGSVWAEAVEAYNAANS